MSLILEKSVGGRPKLLVLGELGETLNDLLYPCQSPLFKIRTLGNCIGRALRYLDD